MKRFTLFGLLIVLLVTVAVASEPVKVFDDLWDQDATERLPSSPGYPVLAVTEVHDADTFEALLHIAPRLIAHVDVRLADAYAPEKDTPKGKELREEVMALIKGADRIVALFRGYDKFGRWLCSVFVYHGDTCADLSQVVRDGIQPPIPEGG